MCEKELTIRGYRVLWCT